MPDSWKEKVNGVEVTCSTTICWGEWDEYSGYEKECSFSLTFEDSGFKITLVFEYISEERMLSLIKNNKDIKSCFFCKKEVKVNPLDNNTPTCKYCLKKYL